MRYALQLRPSKISVRNAISGSKKGLSAKYWIDHQSSSDIFIKCKEIWSFDERGVRHNKTSSLSVLKAKYPVVFSSVQKKYSIFVILSTQIESPSKNKDTMSEISRKGRVAVVKSNHHPRSAATYPISLDLNDFSFHLKRWLVYSIFWRDLSLCYLTFHLP